MNEKSTEGTMAETDLLFIIYDLDRGGAEMRLLDLARLFPPDLVMHVFVTSEQTSLYDEFQGCGVAVTILPISRPYLQPHLVKQLLDYVKSHRIGIVNTFDLKGLLIATAIKQLAGYPVTVIHHTVDLLHTYRPRHVVLHRLLANRVDWSLCNSHQSLDHLAELSLAAERWIVIHNGVDVLKFSRNRETRASVRKELGLSEDTELVGTVANFRPEKNYSFLLESFGRLLQQRPRLMLMCVGGGNLLDKVQTEACRLGLQDRMIFTGYSNRVSDYLSAMDLFVLCSVKESFPNVLIQAMSMEIPVLASRVGGCREIIDDPVDGMMFTSGDQEEFMAKAGFLLDFREDAARIGTNGRKKVERQFTLSAMVGSYVEFYRSIGRNDLISTRDNGSTGRRSHLRLMTPRKELYG